MLHLQSEPLQMQHSVWFAFLPVIPTVTPNICLQGADMSDLCPCIYLAPELKRLLQ